MQFQSNFRELLQSLPCSRTTPMVQKCQWASISWRSPLEAAGVWLAGLKLSSIRALIVYWLGGRDTLGNWANYVVVFAFRISAQAFAVQQGRCPKLTLCETQGTDINVTWQCTYCGNELVALMDWRRRFCRLRTNLRPIHLHPRPWHPLNKLW